MQTAKKTCPIWQPARRVAAFGTQNEQEPVPQKTSRRTALKRPETKKTRERVGFSRVRQRADKNPTGANKL